LRLQSSIVTGVITEWRDVSKVPLVFLADEKVPQGRENASLSARNHILLSILEDTVIQTELLWIEIVVVTAEVVLLAILDRMVED
jgi:hypothetical protein